MALSLTKAYTQTFAATWAIQLCGVASGILSARLLGPQGRGELAVIYYFPVLIASLGSLALPQAMAYNISRRRDDEGEFACAGFWFSLILGLLQAAIFIALVPVLLSGDKQYLSEPVRWFFLYLPAVYAAQALLSVDQGCGRFGRFSLFNILPSVGYVALLLLLWRFAKVSAVVVAMGYLAVWISVLVLRAAAMKHLIFRRPPPFLLLGELLRRGLKYHIPSLAGLVLIRADLAVLIRRLPVEAIGLYVVALAIAMGHIQTSNPFSQVAFVVIAGERNHSRALQRLGGQFRLAQFAILCSGLAAALLTPWIIPLAFGTQFARAVPTAYLLVSATTVWGLARTLENGLRALDKPWPGVWSNLVGLGVLVALGLAALPKWGILGMACAVLLAQITNLLYLVLYTRSHFQVPWAFFYRVDIKSVIHAMRQLLGGFRRHAEAPVAAGGNLRALDTRK